MGQTSKLKCGHGKSHGKSHARKSGQYFLPTYCLNQVLTPMHLFLVNPMLSPRPLSPSRTLDPSQLHIPDMHTLDDCIRFWKSRDDRHGLPLALKLWPKTFKLATYRSEAVKWGKIAKVMHEFVEICGSDHAEFDEHFPGLSNQYAKLCKAVDVTRKARGKLQERPKKRQRVGLN